MDHGSFTVEPTPRRPRTARPRRTHSWGGPLALFVLSLTVFAGRASALSERIVFDFTFGSSLSLLGGTIVTPPDGTLDLGTARIDVEAAAPGVYVAGGQFLLENIEIAGTVSRTIPGAAAISGSYAGTQVGMLAGTVAVGLDGGQFVDPLSLFLAVDVDCTGTGCGALGFPIVDLGISLLSLGFLPVDDLGIPGSARIEVSIPIEIDGVLGTLDLVGVEVSRTLIPEPGTFALLALGLGAMGAKRGSRRA